MTGHEEGTLIQFIRTQALQKLAVTPASPEEVHYSFECKFATAYNRFLALGAQSPKPYAGYHIRKLRLYVLKQRKYEAGLQPILDSLSSLRDPLVDIRLDGRGLDQHELEQLAHVLSAAAVTLRALTIHLQCFAPAVLQVLAEAVPGLHILRVEARAIGGLDNRQGGVFMVRRQAYRAAAMFSCAHRILHD
jgi:hypothetical protein